MELRPYQLKLREDLRAEYKRGKKRVLGVLATGGGKTVTFAFVTHGAVEKGLRTYVVAHRSEILDQISATLKRVGVEHGFIQSGKNAYPRQAMVASIQTLARRMADVPVPDMVVIDECFVKGTMIGLIPIEDIKPGMKVAGFNGSAFVEETVVRLFKKQTSRLVTVSFSDGSSFTCTPNHPVLTVSGFVEGWVEAGSLQSGMMVRTIPSHAKLCDMRECDSGRKTEEEAVRLSSMQIGVLQKEYQHHSERAWRPNHLSSEDKRNEPSGSSGSSEHQTSGDGLETSSEGRKRKGSDPSSNIAGMRFGLGDGSCDTNENGKAVRIPDMLQGGHRELGFEGCCGGGRKHTQLRCDPDNGCEEDGISGIARVVNVEVHERGGVGRFEQVCPDGFVYNFETTGSHTYTAEGVVVHNCHHAVSSQYTAMFAAWPKANFLGVTATPERLDGRGLCGVFDAMVLGPQVQWLIDNRFLAKPVYYAPAQAIDMTGVRKSHGDFDRSELEDLMDKPTITGNAVQHYRKFAAGLRAVAFCVSVAHAEHVAAQFCQQGIPAASIDGKLNPDVRKKRVDDLQAGRISVLTSCELISEGFDLPAVGAAILLRPTASLAMHLQQVGRALRPKDATGGTAIILDHVGNCLRHGLAEEPREWTLDGREARKKKEQNVETKQCESCYAIYAGNACPQCGTERKVTPREIEEAEGELQQIDPAVLAERYAARREEGMCRTLTDFQALAAKRGYKPGWAYHRFAARAKKGRIA